jgi:4-hydroxyphenylpyruvate dioxygenase
MDSSLQLRIAIATNSLGRAGAGHSMRVKLLAAHQHGFQGVEISMDCLAHHAGLDQFAVWEARADRLLAAAADLSNTAKSLSLEIMALNPLGALDSLMDTFDLVESLKEAELWLQICNVMKCPMLLVSSLALVLCILNSTY